MIKKQKLHRPRVPWWTWDDPYECPPWKGAWKKLYNRIARRRGNRGIRKYLNKEMDNGSSTF